MRTPDDDGHEGFAESVTEIEEQLSTNLLAAFGGAYLEAERLHHRLAEVYAHTFKKPLGGCKGRVDEKLVQGHALTLGQLVGEAKKVLPDNLHGDLERQADVRKRIAHVYWRDVRGTIGTPEGKRRGIESLLDMRRELYRIQGGLEDHEREYARRFAAATGQTLPEPKKVPWDELGAYTLPDTPRALRAEETIVSAWWVPVGDGQFLHLECDDGLMLQLGDNGLAWSYAEKQADWRPEPEIQRRLPVKVKPRPPCTEEWDYSIVFNDVRVVVTDHGITLQPAPINPKRKGKR